MFVECEQASTRDLYRMLISSVVPRPIAWVSSQSSKGVLNLAPFSFFNAFSADPPIIGIGIGLKEHQTVEGKSELVPKDSLKNILDTGEFVVNIVSLELADKMNQSSAEYAPNISEFEKAGLTPCPAKIVKPPLVSEAKISMECRLHQDIPLGGSVLVLGRIVGIHIHDDIWKNNAVDVRLLQPIGRLGGISYCKVESIFEMPRPTV